MIIAINSANFIHSAGNDYFNNYFVNLAISKPEHQFIFIDPFAADEQVITSKNCIHVISSPLANNPLMWKIWLDYTLPGIARKYKADLLINTGAAGSLRTRIPQWLFVSDLSFLHFPAFSSKRTSSFFKINMPAWLKKANKIVTISDFLSTEIIEQYSIDQVKIIIHRLVAGGIYTPAHWKEKEATKEQYAEGKEYFLFSGRIGPGNNLQNLLKAFSFFKKRQKSNMQLIITVKSDAPNGPFLEIFKTYKYRNEVKLLMDLPEAELAKITAAAYAFLYPALYESTALFPLRAIQCEVPVITSNNGALNELMGDAALYVDPAVFEDIADKMMLIFKDETKRTELINHGRLITENNMKVKTDDLWNSIVQSIT